MKFELVFEGDTITSYLDKLYENANNERIRDNFLEEVAQEFAEVVDEVIPKWNPNLRYSGLNPEFWKKRHEEGYSDVEILYTGFTGEMQSEPDDIQVWWEFGKYHKGGYSDILGRDYAYYQEYGEDKYGPTKYKAPTFEGHHYVESGLADFPMIIEFYAEEYLTKLIHMK